MNVEVDWKVEYWCGQDEESVVERWLDSLTVLQLKSVAKELKLLACCGSCLRLPHSRALGSKLFELRERQFGFRVYYAFLPGQIVVLLHAGNKSGQTRDIKIARERLRELEITTLEVMT